MSEVYDSDAGDGWRFTWEDSRGFWDLQWLPNKEQWLRGFRPGNVGAWSTQRMPLERPLDHADARRIAKAHAGDVDNT